MRDPSKSHHRRIFGAARDLFGGGLLKMGSIVPIVEGVVCTVPISVGSSPYPDFN